MTHTTHKLNLSCYSCRARVARRVAKAEGLRFIDASRLATRNANPARNVARIMRHTYRAMMMYMRPRKAQRNVRCMIGWRHDTQ